MRLNKVLSATSFGAVLSLAPRPALLAGLLLVIAAAMFVRWFVGLTPKRRDDLIRLITAVRGQ